MNRLFNWLPLAALIEKKIICMHGGIGRSINHVEQIENLQRPITMEAGSVVLMDLLWLAFLATPTAHPFIIGIHFISYPVLTFTGLIQQRTTVLKDWGPMPGVLVLLHLGLVLFSPCVVYVFSPFRPFSFLCSHIVVTSLIGLWSSATTMIFS